MIKSEIIKYIESQGRASKSKIEDYIKEEIGTTGDTEISTCKIARIVYN